jgi:short-subunit dehydrogenase
MKPMDLRNRYTLITGASSGLGLEMARVVAREYGGHVVAVARRKDRLEALQRELSDKYKVDVVPVVADMCRPDEVQRTFEQAIAGREIYGVVLNAGVTFFGHALEQSLESFESMLATNVSSLVRLGTQFTRYLAERRNGGGLMMVSSMAGFWPMPYQAAYGATKAFVTNFGRSLGHEVRPQGVSVTVFTPGGIATEMLDNAGLSRKFKRGDVGIMDADQCARLAVHAMVRRKALYVPGLLNQLSVAWMKLMPHGLMLGSLERLYRAALPPPDSKG